MDSPRFSIKCECVPLHDWMAFACWYSIKKKIPNSTIFIETKITKPLFKWALKLGVPIERKSLNDIKIEPSTMAVRDFYGDFAIVSSKSPNQNTFVDYKEGCGNFVMEEWIDRSDSPFYRALKRFGNANLTVNEMAILTGWEQCHHVYLAVGGP